MVGSRGAGRVVGIAVAILLAGAASASAAAPPTCLTRNAATSFDTPVSIQLQCQDSTGSALSYAISMQAPYGHVTVDSATGAATYTPTSGYSGPDSFTYTGTSIHGTSTPTTVILMVGKAPKPTLSKLSRKGGTFSFKLGETAVVTLTITRKHHKTIKLTRSGKAGSNKIRLSNKLAAGKYTATLTATNAGGSSTRRTLRFKIAK